MVEGSAIIVCHQPDGFCVVCMSIFGETGNAAWAMQALMLSAVTDFWVPRLYGSWSLNLGRSFEVQGFGVSYWVEGPHCC